MHTSIRHTGNVGKSGLAAEAAACIYCRFNTTSTSEEDSVERTDSNVYHPELYELTYVSISLYNRAIYHPAHASSDVASSLAPSPGRRTDASACFRGSRGRLVRLPRGTPA